MVRLLAVLVLAGASVNAQTYTSGVWNYTISNGEATITGYTGSGGAVTIPSDVDGVPVKKVGNGWPPIFGQGNTSVTSITIPNGVTSIGGSAFASCTSLTSITIPNSVTSIGVGAFDSCTSLTSVTIPNSVTSIGVNAFIDCTSLTSITIPNSVTSIESYAFAYCSALTSITIPNSVTFIGYYAFYNCTSLTSMTFLGNAPSFGSDPFRGTPSFTLYYTPGTTGWGATFAGRQTTLSGGFSLTLASDPTKGAVTNSPSGNFFSSGTSVSVSAIAVAGYAFTAWSGDSTSTNNPLILVMNTNKAVTANFGPDNGDTDMDGLSNYQEVIVFNTNPNQPETNSPVAGLYLVSQYQSNRASGRSEVLASPNAYGLFNSNQMLDLKFGGMVVGKTNNQLVLTYQINQSTNLTNWTSYREESLVITNAPADKMFLRILPIQSNSESYPPPPGNDAYGPGG